MDAQATLQDTVFVVVDIETTGGPPDADNITEIAAVKVRGGTPLGEFQTFVLPSGRIPAHITELTGITMAMVHNAPSPYTAVNSFLDFAGDAVWVAHNARFDVGFLRAAAARHGLNWPNPTSVCTVQLARKVLDRQEAPSVKLSALAHLFRTQTSPTHRALDDARTTVEVLYRLIERIDHAPVMTAADLSRYRPRQTAAIASRRALIRGAPAAPGAYLFHGASDEVLYVGYSQNLAQRLSGYFSATDSRRRMDQMVTLSSRVTWITCTHKHEAAYRELQLIDAHRPPYNRVSKEPRTQWWLRLRASAGTAASPLLVSRKPEPGSLGPFARRKQAQECADLLEEIYLPVGHTLRPAAAPDPNLNEGFNRLLAGDGTRLFAALQAAILRHVGGQHFESAARLRDHGAQVLATLGMQQRLGAIARIGQLLLALPDGNGGWDFLALAHGRFAGAASAPRGVDTKSVVADLNLTMTYFPPTDAVWGGATQAELRLTARLLATPGARLVDSVEGWYEPLHGPGSHTAWVEAALDAAHPGP